MENFDISIAMTTYQGAPYLHAQLDSLINQSLQPKEIVICDDRSTDDTLQIIESYRSKLPIVLHVNEKSLGVVRNFSKAISLCSSDYVALCDQDDVWRSDKLEIEMKEMRYIEKNRNGPVIIFSDLEIVSEDLSTINHSFWTHLNASPVNDTFYTLLFGNIVTGCTVLINREMAAYLINIPTDVVMHDYWAALIGYGFGRKKAIQQSLVKYRQHEKNVTNNFARSVTNRITSLLNSIFSGRKEFLQPELMQARKFRETFYEKLPPQHQKDLMKFLLLEHAGFWKRKWESFKSNHPGLQ